MDESLDLITVLDLYRDDVASVAHCDDVFLQILRVCAAADIVLQVVLDAVVRRADLAADVGQCGAGFVGDHVLRDYRRVNAIL